MPGELRRRDVKIGTHAAGSPGGLPRFLRRFEEVRAHLSRADSIIPAASMHHRLLWIHPILDANGRVARLMSHAMLLDTLDTGAVGSIARDMEVHLMHQASDGKVDVRR
jgi:Fic family protein